MSKPRVKLQSELDRLEEHAEIERRARLFLERIGADDGRIEEVVRRITALTERPPLAFGPLAVSLTPSADR